ncbi:hypothetical protein [Stappia sp. ICDLI1TA098]
MHGSSPSLDQIHKLWDDLSAFGAVDIHASRRFLLKEICALIDAQNADWIGCVRLNWSPGGGPMKGWRPRTVFTLNPCGVTSEAIDQAFAEMENGEPDITTTRNVELAGAFWVFPLSELATPEWLKGPSYRNYYRASDRHASIWASTPLTPTEQLVLQGLLLGLT